MFGTSLLGITHYYLTKKQEKSIICAAQKYIGQIALSPSLKKSDLLHILRPLVELTN